MAREVGPILKVGDKVKVKSKLDKGCTADDYPYHFVDYMIRKYGGKIVTIDKVNKYSSLEQVGPYIMARYDTDFIQYRIKEDDGLYKWSLPMFEPINGFDEI